MGDGSFRRRGRARAKRGRRRDREPTTGELRVRRWPPHAASWWRGCGCSRRRCGWPTRPGRPASAWRALPGGRHRMPGGRSRASSPARRRGAQKERPPRRRAAGAPAAPGRAHPGERPRPRPHEAARDLVRAREDARGDLMRARHRLSKLLLRHGLLYESGRAWTGAHEAWLRRQHLPEHPGAGGLRRLLRRRAGGAGRRDRLDEAIAQMAAERASPPVVGRLRCLRGVGTLTAFALCVEIGDWQRLTGATIGAYLGLVPERAANRAHATPAGRSPRPATPTPDGCWWRRPGITAPRACAQARDRAAASDPAPRGGRPRRAGRAAPQPALAPPGRAPRSALHDRGDRRGPRARRLVLEPGRDGREPAADIRGRGERAGRPARTPRGAIRDAAMSSLRATLDPRAAPRPRRTPGHAVTNPRISV